MNIVEEVKRMSNEYDVSIILIFKYLDLIKSLLHEFFWENEIEDEHIIRCLEALVSERASIDFSEKYINQKYYEEPKPYTLTQSLLKNILELFELKFYDKNIDISNLEKEYIFMK